MRVQRPTCLLLPLVLLLLPLVLLLLPLLLLLLLLLPLMRTMMSKSKQRGRTRTARAPPAASPTPPPRGEGGRQQHGQQTLQQHHQQQHRPDQKRPDVSDEEAAAYVNGHVMPATLVAEAGWYRPTPPSRNPNRSLIWLYGVVYDRPAVEGRKKPRRKVYCQATEECRDSNSFIAGVGTGNYSRHLEEIHQSTSDRSKGLKAKKVRTQLVLRQAVVKKQRMVHEGGEAAGHRHEKLKYVRNIVIGTFQPFNYMERQLVRQHYKTLNPAFPVEELHHKAVRHIINELYSATQISGRTTSCLACRPGG